MSSNEYHCIGAGACGSVWALDCVQPAPTPPSFSTSAPTSTSSPRNAEPSTNSILTLRANHVLKRADGSTHRSIAHDMAMHRHFLTATKHQPHPFLVPKSYCMLDAADPLYPTTFPPGVAPCLSYCLERIPFLPVPVRSGLIDKYCPANLQTSVRASKKDEDCLVRLYCGRRRSGRERERAKRFFSLRNYGASIDQLEDLDVDTWRVVEVLAKALVLCYWVARVDANDVEFVFGRAPADDGRDEDDVGVGRGDGMRKGKGGSEAYLARTKDAEDFQIFGERCVVWMLDFDCVREMEMNEKGVQQAVDAFWRNDPYFPRPWANERTDEDQRLWKVFREKFLAESESVLGAERKWLAREWIERVEEEGLRRAKGGTHTDMLSRGVDDVEKVGELR